MRKLLKDQRQSWLGERVEELILLTSHIGTIAGVLQKLKTLTGLE